jgi:2-methylisocitrate lyase-like PEP mutase family enzyme
LHKAAGVFLIPNRWDTGTARILATKGFQALATTSAGLAFALGKPDGAIFWREELEHCRIIVDATPLPVSADLERGTGDTMPRKAPLERCEQQQALNL